MISKFYTEVLKQKTLKKIPFAGPVSQQPLDKILKVHQIAIKSLSKFSFQVWTLKPTHNIGWCEKLDRIQTESLLIMPLYRIHFSSGNFKI